MALGSREERERGRERVRAGPQNWLPLGAILVDTDGAGRFFMLSLPGLTHPSQRLLGIPVRAVLTHCPALHPAQSFPFTSWESEAKQGPREMYHKARDGV